MRNNKNLFVSVVIAAAGTGSRMKMDINKQYIEVCGKQVLARTIQVFEDLACIDEVIIVANGQDILYCKENVIDRYGFKKVKTIVSGGAERQHSVYNGLKEVDAQCDIVLVHDGARPFVKEESILGCIEAAQEFGAACVAVPVKDTIKWVNAEGFVKETLDRSALRSIQTPQGFQYSLIMDAHKKAAQEGFIGTDDAVLIERLGYQMKLVMGSYDNIKITTKEDLAMAEAIVGAV